MPLPKQTQARLKFIDDKHDQLTDEVKSLQQVLWDKTEAIIAKLKTDEGKITGNASNYSLLGQFNAISRQIKDGPKKKLIKGIVNNLLTQENFIQRYFNEFLGLERKTVESRAHEKLLIRIGYDGHGFVNTGILDDLWRDETEIRAIKAQIIKGIAGGTSWSDFQTQMKTLVIGTEDRLGLTEAQFQTITRDLYAQNDRAIVKNYADEYGLGYFIFQGGLMTSTRPFCRARNNRIFTRKEIQSWSDLTFEGKPKVYDPFLDVGGHNCRHVLDPISDELAAELRAQVPAGRADELKEALSSYTTNIDKSFLGKMPEFEVDVTREFERGRYDSLENTVRLPVVYTPKSRKRVVYHEFSHAYHFRRGLITNDFVDDSIKADYDAIRLQFNETFTELADWAEGVGKYWNKALAHYEAGEFDKEGIITMVGDIIASLTRGNSGFGHDSAYWAKYNRHYMEFFVHSSEAKYFGNPLLKKKFPELHDRMIEFANKHIK